MQSLIKELQSALEKIPMSSDDRIILEEIIQKIENAKSPQAKMDLYAKWINIFVNAGKVIYEITQNT